MPTDVVAAAEAAFRAQALERGRQAAEVAADLRSDFQDLEERAAYVGEFAQAWAESYIEGAREERARIKSILETPGASMVMPTGDGGMLRLHTDADGVVWSVKRRPRGPFAGRAL
ncbi:hypothetical protein [Methylobacterium sp. J-070]|uniref:hypothetical protein n=1 Tax=Methylobacterium sp. J-070 TaxID=2836650 RepID=UPI001FBB0DC3|nr:hypothetical protein [Methylobacterium sp. J-070]MCJ2051257.1 hypothetical protein [Methylobacterium sp. J-070]